VSLEEGTVVAYEGDSPVFATLVSPGAGGVGRPGRDPVKASTTPRGLYRIQYKYRSQTMSPQKDRPETRRTFWIAEVPFAQYFRIPFALHASYWHEDFGQPMSGGCVNLSPEDALFMFHFTRPSLPPGWEAVWAGGEAGFGTRVLVTR
jgi:lipoprotein-anchoring transpeptidase ErfK/SrfK